MNAAMVVGGVQASPRKCGRSRIPGATERGSSAAVSSGTSIYRKSTAALLRRYLRTSFEMGRAPSMLGNLNFRGKSSHSTTRSLEDAVIFVHDVESCMNKLDQGSEDLLVRITLQEYTQEDVARMSGTSSRSVMRRHAKALDQLSEILLEVDLLDIREY